MKNNTLSGKESIIEFQERMEVESRKARTEEEKKKSKERLNEIKEKLNITKLYKHNN